MSRKKIRKEETPQLFSFDDFLADSTIKKPTNIEDVLEELIPGFKLHEWQKQWLHHLFDPILDTATAKENKCVRLAIAGGHGVGKTTFDCLVMLLHLYFCGTYENEKTYRGGAISGREEQLRTVVWGELRRLAFISTYPFRITSKSISYDDKHEIRAIVCNQNNPQSLQGMHAENVLFILDEAGAIEDFVFDKVADFFTDSRGIYLVTGNPYVDEFAFHNLFSSKLWASINIARDISDPNDLYIQDVVSRYGVDSDEYRIKILGLFPLSHTNRLFPKFLIDEACERYNQFPGINRSVCFGIDIASGEGADFSVLTVRSNSQVVEKIKVKCRFREFLKIIREKYQFYIPVFMGVDRNGVGHETYQNLQDEFGGVCKVIPVITTTLNDAKYNDVRTWLLVQVRNWMSGGGAINPNDKELIDQMAITEIERTSRGKIKVKSKKEVIGPSPDDLDSLAYSFIGSLFEVY